MHQNWSFPQIILSDDHATTWRVAESTFNGEWSPPLYIINNFSGSNLPEDEWLSPTDSTIDCLEVQFCNSLSSLPLRHQSLSNLESLTIWSCPKLTTLVGLKDLPSLWYLVIWDCAALQLQPGEQLPSTLEMFEVYGCESLSGLTLLNLRRVISIRIGNCNNLSWVMGLHNLTSLQFLWIVKCPKLHIPPDEFPPFKLSGVLIQDSPRMMTWCQQNEISYVEVDYHILLQVSIIN